MEVIDISVRNLVEFVFRHGDIDNRHVSRDAVFRMQEGSRIHRNIQDAYTDNYEAEVYLKYVYSAEKYMLQIDGRADGIIKEGNNYIVEEIKSTYKNTAFISQPVDVHIAQAKCYAYMLAEARKLSNVGIVITYCNVRNLDVKRFRFNYSYEEIANWFVEVMREYGKWAEFDVTRKKIRKESIKNTEFPFEYRKGQKLLAANVYNTIKCGRKLYLEAPTGVGKTITTLFPAIKAVGEDIGDKIFYLTAKNITSTVAVRSIKILNDNGLDYITCVLTAKEKICILNEPECNPSKCPVARGHFDRINDCIYEIINNEKLLTRELIEQYARSYSVCPFELSLDLSLFSDLIICDYNYCFDPHAYLKRFFSEGVSGQYIFLVDEAHNLLDRGRDMYSAVLVKDDVLAVKNEVSGIIKNNYYGKETNKYLEYICNGLDSLYREMLILGRSIDDSQDAQIIKNISSFENLFDRCHKVCDEMNNFFQMTDEDTDIRKKLREYYFILMHFVLIAGLYDEHYRAYVMYDESNRIVCKLMNIDPSKQLSERMQKAVSTILFSATLIPIKYYKGLLGGENKDYEVYAETVFKEEQLGIFVADDVTARYTERGINTYSMIASYIRRIVDEKDGNYMIFFPSYEFAYEIFKLFMEEEIGNKRTCILQREGMREPEREKFLTLFKQKNVIAFCVMGGIFGEGIDLQGDLLIGAIIVGNGMPKPTLEQDIIFDYFENEHHKGFEYAYCYPGMNKVLQAAGRVIRTVNDRGIVVLLENRFLDYRYQKLFPREWKHVERVNYKNVHKKIEAFWDGVDC